MLAALLTKMSDTNKNENENPPENEETVKPSEELDTPKAPEMDHDTSATTTKTESDYESADSEEETEDRLRKRDNEDGTEEEGDEEEGTADEEELYGDKREEGDGEEESGSAKEKKLDDDEDRRNPQYIPKKGTFYEHDDRGADEPDEEAESKEEKPKKAWKESADRWSHDKFNEADQAPKSRDELVTSYGYDIRSEEGPPRARRRRRYGRGPNKYDRNWEDENAYSKPSRGGAVVGRGGGPRRQSDGGRLSERSEGTEEIQVDSEKQFPSLPPKRNSDGPRGRKGAPGKEREVVLEEESPPKPTNQPTKSGRGRGVGPSGRIIRGSGRIIEGRGRGGRGGGRPRDFADEGDKTTHLENNIKNLSLKDSGSEQFPSRDFRRQQKPKGEPFNQAPPSERRQANVPPRMQQEGSGNRPKRYSSQRQRSLPESSASYDQPPPASGPYYEQGFQQHQLYPEAAVGQPQPVAAPLPNAVPVSSATQILPPGTNFTPSYPSPTQAAAFIAPAQPPTRIFPAGPQPTPPFMAPPNPNMLNYVQPPATQFPAAFPPFPSFPAVPPATPPQPPAEMYVPTGITYYSTQNQVPRPTPLKRPKAAIPIVPPPSVDDKQQDNQEEDQVEGSEKVNEKEENDGTTEIVQKVEEVKQEVHPTEISA
ncbi:protein CASC3 [Neocloeon triangulifer]|uniref:protein CASC3 n=1 Tax=Neocloeon triangulifer TaxID=2078957 RepID=UPI00286F7A3F|nr:protein CASC3 [Neocloeon triangulifer]